MNCQPLFVSFDSAKVRTFFKYPNFFHKNLQTFLHFICKCLKINVLHKQKIFVLIYSQNGQKYTDEIDTFEMVQNMALNGSEMALFCVQNIEQYIYIFRQQNALKIGVFSKGLFFTLPDSGGVLVG